MHGNTNLRVLMITSEWPSPGRPELVPFLVQRVEHLRKAEIDVEVFAFRGNKLPINYMKAWLKVRRLYDIEQFDVLDVQFGQSGFIALPRKVPLVVTFHGSDLHGIVGSKGNYTLAGVALRLLSRYVARRANQVIVVSEHLTRYLPRGLPFHVIPCGVDLEVFRPMPQSEARGRLGLPLDKRLVLFAANPHSPHKRYHLAKAAVDLIKSQFQVDLLAISDVPHKQVSLYMNACDVLVLTSTHEGSPTVIKEALACGLPIVSVNVGDVAQRLGEVQGCVLCADDSPATIAEGLAQALRAGSRVHGNHVMANLDERIMIQRLIEVYQAALADGAQAVRANTRHASGVGH